jgi:hypothetical protein
MMTYHDELKKVEVVMMAVVKVVMVVKVEELIQLFEIPKLNEYLLRNAEP